ncbi:hypothetical protein O181_039886 [Austropuccinia psidii MF-1]|uniref:t-SNARE coiled-coil homology domain-containing protein n=1 Tax=Austropuccinia psidii MF-1 TaxID=1389203 RepID=A0A9Q3HCX0_9BASI|nr:hypothetical protein [Austropuccinia psidii MF-1]
MSRDRLTSVRGNQSDLSHLQHAEDKSNLYKTAESKELGDVDSYEMQEKVLDMSQFMDEVSSFNDAIKSINQSIDQIRNLNSRLLSELDDVQHQSIANELTTITSHTSRLIRNLKNRITSLQSATFKLPQSNDYNVRCTQIGALKKRLMDAIIKYQSVEQENRQKCKARIERQYRIVKPDASPEEIRQAIDSDDGGQIFSQALMSSNRYGDARAAFNEVRERHQDIKRIEQTLTELMEMFNDLATMVEEQDQLIQNAETNAVDIQRDVEQAGQHITKARNSAAAARRKRWICFIIMVLILLIIGAIIAIVIVTQRNKS